MLESTYRLKYNHLKYFIRNNCVEKEHAMKNWGDCDTVMCKTFVTGLYSNKNNCVAFLSHCGLPLSSFRFLPRRTCILRWRAFSVPQSLIKHSI